MEAALRILLPRMLATDVSFEVYQHQSKDLLLRRLPARLKGYAAFVSSTYRIVVIVDRDDDDATELRARLDSIADAAGFGAQRPLVVNRLAIEELEAWYFGDWAAVRAAFPKVPAEVPKRARYRRPDAIAGGTWEALEQLLQKYGYHKGGLRKTEAARAISEHMVPARNESPSFAALRSTLGSFARE